MPIIWRYLMGYFLKIALVCALAFVSILLTMQLDEIAHFAALGAPLNYILIFTFHQIPYILPIVIPLSCLIASLLLIQRLSSSHELTALRASGYSLSNIMAPIWLIAAVFTLCNFWMTSELATQSHMQTNLLKTELRSINPLLMLNNKHLMRLKGFYFDTLGASKVGESASQVVLALPDRRQERIHLMIAQQLKANTQILVGEGITLVTGIGNEEGEDYDQLLVENMKKSETQVSDFSDMLQKKVGTINNDYLQMPLLLARIQDQRQQLANAQIQGESKEQIKSLKIHLNKSLSEITKRHSIAFAVFSFTLMGTSFGISIGRRRKNRSLYCVMALTTFYLIAFFTAKGLDHQPALASILYMAPHIIIICSSLIVLKCAAKGIE